MEVGAAFVAGAARSARCMMRESLRLRAEAMELRFRRHQLQGPKSTKALLLSGFAFNAAARAGTGLQAGARVPLADLDPHSRKAEPRPRTMSAAGVAATCAPFQLEFRECRRWR